MSVTDPYQPTAYVPIEHPEWSKNATIYQINDYFGRVTVELGASSQLTLEPWGYRVYTA